MNDTSTASPGKAGSGLVLAIVYVTALFFIWALVTNLLDPLLKTMKTVFTLTPVQANLTGFAFFIAYGVMSLPSAAFLSKLGYANPPARQALASSLPLSMLPRSSSSGRW